MVKKKKMEEDEKEDRISDLPDSMIQHILSFLPSTKEAIRTGILSKRWQNQWTQVPVLILNSTAGMSRQNYLNFIEKVLILHSCSKIRKFHFDYPSIGGEDPQFDAKILFATRKHVEDLCLGSIIAYNQEYTLPKFLFHNASLVKLRTIYCRVSPEEKVNWGCLTSLIMEGCILKDQGMQHILYGSPLLKSLELIKSFFMLDKLVIASKSLKRLVLRDDELPYNSCIEIVCPNLEELSLKNITAYNPEVLGPMVESVLSVSLLLQSFEMIRCSILISMVIASKSLKRLVLGHLVSTYGIELSCPKLEKLKLFDCLSLITPKLHDLPTSLSATCDFYYHFQLEDRRYEFVEEQKGLIIEILQQVHHVKKLKLGIWFMEILSAIEVEGLICPVLNIKSLTLNYPHLNRHHAGIACLLRSSPILEKLVIKVPLYGQFHKTLHRVLDLPKTNDYGEKYWNSKNAYRLFGIPSKDN